MKFTLTIADATKEELAMFFGGSSLISLNSPALMIPGNLIADGNVSGTVHTPPMPPNGNGGAPTNDDDDNGPANANAPAVDAQGLPWDERIHSKNKGMNADRTWRKKRNVDPALVATVEAALRGPTPGMNNPAQQPQMQMQQPVQQQQPQFVPPMPGQQQPTYTPPMPDQQHMQQPVQQMQPAPMDFSAFMTHLAGQMQKRDAQGMPLITTEYLAGVAQRLSAQFGRPFNAITDVSTDPNAIAMAVNFIANDGRWN